MKQLTLILGIAILLTSCELFENKEKKAIETCKKTKVQFDSSNIFGYLGLSISGLTAESTWLDYANMLAKQDPNTKLDWTAEKIEDAIYLVSFADEIGWGQRWEVNLDEQIVRHINGNEYLSRKYGLSRLDKEEKFKITKIKTSMLKLERNKDYYSNHKSKNVVYIMKAQVLNNTDKTLIKAEITGKLQVIFKDKTIESVEEWESGFKRKVNKSRPWKPQEELEFYIKAKDIEDIYLQYEPEYVFFNINISVEDPVGFKYNKDIEEYDLREEWKVLRQEKSHNGD